ncbi:MAG: citramalate synthase [Deltaproteobacteria bacterium]|nr:citramalate synthase [Deltaproteobacteria bacterium]
MAGVKEGKDEGRLVIYDTTLRDGTQAEEISLQVKDKIAIAHCLDDLGIDFIEGGWPGSNPKDMEFFERAADLKLTTSRIAAFGSTRRKKIKAADDPQIQALLKASDVITIFGKSWHLHVKEALRTSLEENLEMIHDSVSYLKANADVVFYDAEHFFDGYKDNPEYALKTLQAAHEAAADCLVLCDTNGGTMPSELERIIMEVQREIPDVGLGAHMHNDSECAVANSLLLLQLGGRHVQGTINGWGERCGNANLCSIIPAVIQKMGMKTSVSPEKLSRLREISRTISEFANMTPYSRQPYVGRSAFAHKGGVHVSAMQRDRRTYEHIDPSSVGNRTRVLLSDLSGRSNILFKAAEFGIQVDDKDPAIAQVLGEIKDLENRGFMYESAEASFELLLKKALGRHRRFFGFKGFRVIDAKREWDKPPLSEATIMVEVDGSVEHTASVGHGPVDAMDAALRKALTKFYPVLEEVRLLDYKVRILPENKGTAAVTLVIIDSGDGKTIWSTVGVSENILEASWQALVDSIEYKLLREETGET